MQLRRGLKSNLPESVALGEPLITIDTQELYIGTTSGVKKVSDLVISDTEPSVTNRDLLWLVPSSNEILVYKDTSWTRIKSKDGSTDFGGF